MVHSCVKTHFKRLYSSTIHVNDFDFTTHNSPAIVLPPVISKNLRTSSACCHGSDMQPWPELGLLDEQ